MRALAIIRSLLFALVFYSSTAIAVLGAYPALAFGRRALQGEVLLWARVYRWSARWLLGIRVVIEGTPPAGRVLVVAKHEAMFETIVLIELLRRPATVLKQELADLPFFGRAACLYGMIPVDRSGAGRSLKAMVLGARAAMADDRPVVIFPEGTRVPPGEQPALHPGFAALYKALDVPLVPLAVDSGRLWPRGLVKHAGTITLRFGEPIPPGMPRDQVAAQVHAAINALNG